MFTDIRPSPGMAVRMGEASENASGYTRITRN